MGAVCTRVWSGLLGVWSRETTRSIIHNRPNCTCTLEPQGMDLRDRQNRQHSTRLFSLRFCNGMQLAIAFGANKKFGGGMNKKEEAKKKKRRFRTGKAIRVLLVSSSDLTRDSN